MRVANTGVTAIIDPYGRMVTAAPRNDRTAIEGLVHFRSDKTFYTQYGDVFAYLNIAAVLASAAVVGWRNRRVRPVVD